MDASSRRFGGGHLLVRHDLKMVSFMTQYYGAIDSSLKKQSEREVILHIALDKGLVNHTDVSLMSELTRVILRRSGPRRWSGGA